MSSESTASGESRDGDTIEGNGMDGDEADVAGETTTESDTGLASNVAGALTYLLGPITGILFYIIETEDRFVRFHAAQSIVVFGGLFALSIVFTVVGAVLAAVPVIGWVVGIVLGLVSLLLAPIGLVLWLLLMYKAYVGEEYALPVVGGVVENNMMN
ncbi:DUF4870 domain-containing protein [Halorubrum vacuolatum]|uniref:Uncharacterized membrane protein n=1 Tax=Halorubrum vacuolatum TaxID=63740 RepID=A0A238XJD5_HALVU|nr:hypothetical protein [Halorubrum vacuolatum]SNR58593.1 Uncharacterized membrane protein [Halorubrum vacuolatum]